MFPKLFVYICLFASQPVWGFTILSQIAWIPKTCSGLSLLSPPWLGFHNPWLDTLLPLGAPVSWEMNPKLGKPWAEVTLMLFLCIYSIPSFSPPKQVFALETSLREAEDKSDALKSRLEEEEAKNARLEEIKGGQTTAEDLKQKESQQSESEESQNQDEPRPKNLKAPKTFVRYQVLFCPQLLLWN